MPEYTLRMLAELTQSELVGNPETPIRGVNNLEAASSDEAAFLENPLYTRQLETTHAGCIFIKPKTPTQPRLNYLITPTPSLAFQQLIELFLSSPTSGFENIHPTAVVHDSAQIGAGVTLGPHVVIEKGAVIGAHTHIAARGYVGANTSVGEECYFYPGVTVREECSIGNRVILQPGAVIGSCGFGYFTDAKGHHLKLKQLGRVVLEDDVEIGANTTIDRARFQETRIRRGTKIDNLVQIGHQVDLGEDNIIVSQVGIAGSTSTGRHVVMGGQVGVAGHLSITNGVTLAACSAVSKSITKPGTYMGVPAIPAKEFGLQFVQLRNIGKLVQKVKDLESELAKLQSKAD